MNKSCIQLLFYSHEKSFFCSLETEYEYDIDRVVCYMGNLLNRVKNSLSKNIEGALTKNHGLLL